LKTFNRNDCDEAYHWKTARAENTGLDHGDERDRLCRGQASGSARRARADASRSEALTEVLSYTAEAKQAWDGIGIGIP
jgi:hypothetical protein